MPTTKSPTRRHTSPLNISRGVLGRANTRSKKRVDEVITRLKTAKQLEREAIKRAKHKRVLLDSLTNDDHLLLEVAAEVAQDTKKGTPLFRTAPVVSAGAATTPDLYDIFLSGLMLKLRVAYNCNTCRQFFARYGNLVTINENGSLTSWLFANPLLYPKVFDKAIRAVKEAVEKGVVTEPFYSREIVLGVAKTGLWEHFAVLNPTPLKNERIPEELVADSHTDYDILSRSLIDFDRVAARKAVQIAHHNKAAKDIAQWFHDLHESIAQVTGNGRRVTSKRRHHLIWLAAETALAGRVVAQIGALLGAKQPPNG